MSAEDPHRWARRRFAARRAGLLDDEEERRISEHLAGCDPCGAAWRADSAVGEEATPRGTAPADPHIPAGVLATWPRSSGRLKGFERALVREHLERCESCRQDLELLGYAPTLETVPDLEWSGAASTAADMAVPRILPEPSEPERIIRVIKLPARRTDWARWAFGGWAAIASAAALLLVVNPGLIGRGGEGLPPGGPVSAPPVTSPGTTAPPIPAASPAALTLAGRPLKMSSGLRGEAARLPALTITPETRFVPLAFEPLDLPRSFPVEVALQREGDPSILRLTVRNDDLNSGRLLLTSGSEPFQPGTYVVRLQGGPAPDAILPEPEVAEYRFVLRVAAGASPP